MIKKVGTAVKWSGGNSPLFTGKNKLRSVTRWAIRKYGTDHVSQVLGDATNHATAEMLRAATQELDNYDAAQARIYPHGSGFKVLGFVEFFETKEKALDFQLGEVENGS